MPRTRPADRAVAYFAAFLDLLERKVVVVGGGSVATAKVRSLLPCRPRPLLVVAPSASNEIQHAASAGELTWVARAYLPADLDQAVLVFAATDDRRLNARIAADARLRGVPVLAVDDAPNCDFIAPALVRRGDLTVAISTNGRSPAMARRTRERLQRALPAFWADLVAVAAGARERLGSTRTLVDPDRWQSALDGEVEQLVEAGQLEAATDSLVGKLERSLFEATSPRTGSVSLVGAGPGDPDLLTLRALKRLQSADVVVHDRLVSDGVLAHVPPAAERIDVGKRAGHRGPTQAEINALLVRLASDGRRVVRLKGGDPFVFGRGGEEALALARAGITFEIVPGLSSALAAPAAAGIPVTHRGLSGSVTIVNGHAADELQDWTGLARARGSLVFLMAVEHLQVIAAALLKHGRPADEPAAIVEWATTPRQRVVEAPLSEIASAGRAAQVSAPAVFIVGPVAALRGELGGARRRAGLARPSPARTRAPATAGAGVATHG
jgi:uroporphyrin-III C-methyltransferase/precorrin-2 dehydrogenase/sirohydrochlorin ferrochelatase